MTPLQLKRKAPYLESTIDRTLHPNLHPGPTLADIVPSFATSSKEMPPNIMAKEQRKRVVTSTTFQNTADLQERVYQFILEDSEKSEMNIRSGFRNKCYLDYPTQMKVIKGNSWPIPDRVNQLYKTFEEDAGVRPSFMHGCLPTTAIYYFAIQNRVLFYDFGKAVRCNSLLEDYLLNEFQFEQRVFQLKEVSWSAPFFNELKNKNILLVSGPWRIDFLVMEMPQYELEKADKYKRWIKITMLNYHFTIGSKRAAFLTEGDRQIFYLDEGGMVNRLWFQRNSYLEKLFRGDTFKLATQTIKKSLSSNFFYLNRKATLFDKVRHYHKVITSEFKSLFTSNAESYGLVYDKQRRLIFSLVDTRCRERVNNHQSLQYSYSKMLSCWKIVENKLQLQCQVSELQLLTCPQNEQILTYNIGNNNKIAKIAQVNQAYYPESCLLVVLEGGTRLYLKINNKQFQIATFQYPPSLDSTKQKTRTRKCVEYTKAVQLVHFYSETNTNILTIKDQGQNHTFLLWKDSQTREEENCTYINWGQSIYQGQGGETPQQSYLFKSTLGFTTSKKATILKSLVKLDRRHNLLSSQSLTALHSLSRDLFEQVPLYIHASERYLQYFFTSRPIDMMFMTIAAEIYDKKIIANIFPELQKADVQYLLLQLLCDQQGLYLKDIALIECLSNYVRVCLESGVYKSFQAHRSDFLKTSAPKNRKFTQQSLKPEIVGRSTLPADIYSKICDLILDLCTQDKKNSELSSSTTRYQQQITLISKCILQYLSRVLRFVWNQQLQQISPKTIHLVSMIEPLLSFIEFIFDKDYINRAKLDIQRKRYTVFDSSIRFQSRQEKTQKLEERKQQFDNVFQPIQDLKYFINKIIQLLILSTQVNLKAKKTFANCLGIQPEFLQEHIFNYLILNYNMSFKVLENFRTIFPVFIGKNLQKSLKIYNQTRKLDSKTAYLTAKDHINLPDYLLAYLKDEKGLKSWQVKEMRGAKEQKLKLVNSFGSKEAIEELKAKLLQGQINLHQRSHLISIINSQLQLYLESKKEFQDNFYRVTRREVNQTSKIITFQEILLDEYCKKDSKDAWVLQHLQNSLLKPLGLKEIVVILKSCSIRIIFYYLFKEDIKDLQKQSPLSLFQDFFNEEFQLYKNVTRSGLLSYLHSERTWKHLEEQLLFIIGKIKNYVEITGLIEIFQKSLKIAVKTKLDMLPIDMLQPLSSYLASKKSAKKHLEEWVLTQKYPIVGFMLVKAGIDASFLQEFYLKQLHLKIYAQEKITEGSLPILLDSWLNLCCLMVEFKGDQISKFIAKTKELIGKVKDCLGLTSVIGQNAIDHMEMLAEILRLIDKDSKTIP